MKKTRQAKKQDDRGLLQQSKPGYGAQDFEQGRGGMQSGHVRKEEEEAFSQFQNTGRAGYAAQRSANSSNEKAVTKK